MDHFDPTPAHPQLPHIAHIRRLYFIHEPHKHFAQANTNTKPLPIGGSIHDRKGNGSASAERARRVIRSREQAR